jgi:hypothetical protein
MAGVTAGSTGGALSGTEAGADSGTEAGADSGTMAGAQGGMSTPVNMLSEAQRRSFCEAQIDALVALIPASGPEREAYIEQSCSFAGLIEDNEPDCEQAVIDCRADIDSFDREPAISECMAGELFSSCSASVEALSSCQIATTTFYADMIQGINIGGVDCSDAGDVLALAGILTQLREAPASLCEPEARACLE